MQCLDSQGSLSRVQIGEYWMRRPHQPCPTMHKTCRTCCDCLTMHEHAVFALPFPLQSVKPANDVDVVVPHSRPLYHHTLSLVTLLQTKHAPCDDTIAHLRQQVSSDPKTLNPKP